MTARGDRRRRAGGRRGAREAGRPAPPSRSTAATGHGRERPAFPDDPRLVVAGLVVLGTLLWTVAYRQLPHPIDNIDAEEYASIGRALAAGQGFTTPTMPLNGLAYLQGKGFDLSAPWPNITRFPLPSIVAAALFLPLGATPLAAALASGLFYLLGVPPLYLLARRVGGPAVAVLATVLYLLHPGILQAATSGMTESASACFLIASCWLLLRGGRWAPLLAGLLLGIAYWNRQTLVVFALPLGLWLWWQVRPRRRRGDGTGGPAWRPLALYLGAALLAMAPWLLRNWLLVGDPTFNIQTATVIPFGTRAAPPDFPWYIPEYTPPLAFVAGHAGDVAAKWFQQAGDLPDVVWNALGPPFLLLLAVSGALLAYPADVRALRWAALGCLVVHAAAYSLVGNIERFYSFFVPLVAVFAADALVRWTRRFAPGVPWLGAASGAVLAVAVGWAPVAPVLGLPVPRSEPPIAGQLGAIVDVSIGNQPAIRARTPADALIATNLPWSVGWQADRRAIPLPPTPEALGDLEARFGLRPDFLYLNPQVFIVAVPEGWRTWDRVRDGRSEPPAGFALDRRFGDGSALFRRSAP